MEWGCAVNAPPSGGQLDTIAPEVIASFPVYGTKNFSGKKVKIQFSKYMDLSSVNSNVFIQPEVKSEFSWWRKTLTINFREDLKPNTTYSIQLGTDYKDWKRNKPKQAYSIIFSTGNEIDSSIIAGKVWGETESKFVYAYSDLNHDFDTLNFANTKPDYKIQLAENGLFAFNALKPSNYRIIAVSDVRINGIYDPYIDEFGSYFKDVKLDSIIDNVQLRLGPKFDTLITDSTPTLMETDSISTNDSTMSDSSEVEKVYFSNIKGSLIDSAYCSGNYVLVLKNSKNEEVYTKVFGKDYSFEFNEAKAGAYTIEVFCDRNLDSTFSYGKDFPFEFSERFMLVKETIKVKEKWDVEDIRIVVNW